MEKTDDPDVTVVGPWEAIKLVAFTAAFLAPFIAALILIAVSV